VRGLDRIELPGEDAARERTWRVVEAAFAEREPVPRPSHWPRVAAAALVASALVAAALSPPGRAVLDEIREVVGVERAQPALFSLPAPGRLLVASDAGVWVVQEDGSRRLLGDYREATWSPFGRFVAAVRANELAALEPDGDVRWTLPRPGVRSPRWTGTETDTQIAYVDRTGIRVVAGDGTGDRLLVPRVRGPIAWKPGPGFVLAYSSPGEIRLIDAVAGTTRWQAPLRGTPAIRIEWSPNGRRLLVLSAKTLRVYDDRGNLLLEIGPGAAPLGAAALSPSGQAVAYVLAADGRSQLWTVPRIRPDANAARRVFSGAGQFATVAWSPDGRWLLVTWPAAGQWIFVRADGRGIRAVSNISRQFRSGSFPRIEGWCCTR
jgi:WD40-like Beta Propeller Repeat